MRFNQIDNSDMLIAFLERQATQHSFVFHYTKVDALKAILKNKTWRLGQARKMNDLHEYLVKGRGAEALDNIYTTCFSFGDEDNIAMWSLYGKPRENAVRLRLPYEAIRDWLKDLTSSNISNNLSQEIIQSMKISFHDICYYLGYMGERKVLSDCPLQQDICDSRCKVCPEKALLWWSQRNLHPEIVENEIHGLKPELIGYVKNSAWAYENETRLSIFIPDIPISPNNHIDIPVSGELLENMQVSLGPRNTLPLEEVQKLVADYLYNGDINCVKRLGQVTESYYRKNNLLQ